MAVPALAAAPSLSGAVPRGLQRGQTTTVTLSGNGIGAPNAEIQTLLPGTLGAVKVASPNQISVPITVPPDAPVGFYPIGVRTDDGLTARLLLASGDFPESSEKEPNDDAGNGQAVSLPTTINGSCGGADRDFYRISARRGDRIVVEVEARRLGSGLEPALTIVDPAGHQLASDVDATPLDGGDRRLLFTAPQDGELAVIVNDE